MGIHFVLPVFGFIDSQSDSIHWLTFHKWPRTTVSAKDLLYCSTEEKKKSGRQVNKMLKCHLFVAYNIMVVSQPFLIFGTFDTFCMWRHNLLWHVKLSASPVDGCMWVLGFQRASLTGESGRLKLESVISTKALSPCSQSSLITWPVHSDRCLSYTDHHCCFGYGPYDHCLRLHEPIANRPQWRCQQMKCLITGWMCIVDSRRNGW